MPTGETRLFRTRVLPSWKKRAQREKMAPPAVPRKFGLLSHQYSPICVIPSQKEFGASWYYEGIFFSPVLPSTSGSWQPRWGGVAAISPRASNWSLHQEPPHPPPLRGHISFHFIPILMQKWGRRPTFTRFPSYSQYMVISRSNMDTIYHSHRVISLHTANEKISVLETG